MSEHPVLTVERREAILDLVVREGAMRVSDLAKRFDVSSATVRRDLEALEDRGDVRRVHGGAIASERRAERPGAGRLLPEEASAPRHGIGPRIGRAVVEMIGGDETIFLSPGSLALGVAQQLVAHPHITVITSSLEVAHWLAKHTKHRLITTGGQVEQRNMGLVGQLARNALSTLRADRVIVELDGVSAVEGLTHDSLPQAEIAQLLMETGSKIVILVAPDRVGRVAATRVAPASSADALVTTREAPAAYLWDLSEVGIEIVLA